VTTISKIEPLRAVEGGRVTLHGSGFPVEELTPVTMGGAVARVAFASPTRVIVTVPGEVEGGRTPLRVRGAPGGAAFVSIGALWATGLHPVDNPAFDRQGHLYVT
jgi:IPT/TIG domain